MRGEIKKEAFLFLIIISLGVLFLFYNNVFALDVPTNGTTESISHLWIRGTAIQSAELDSTHNLIYFVGNNGLFGFYNITSNTTTDLRKTDSSDWLGNKTIYGLTVDSANDLVYLVGHKSSPCGSVTGDDLFAVYNRTSNITENLNSTDSENWFGSSPQINDVVIDSSNGLAYFRAIFSFGVYNRTSNTSESLTLNIGAYPYVCDMIVHPTNHLVYFGGDDGLFGAYNRTSNLTENLTSTSSSPGFSDRRTLSLCRDSTHDMIYLVGSGNSVTTLFSVYNVSKNVTENLNMTGNVIRSTEGSLNDCIFNPNDNLVYIEGAWGAFGVYNRTSNITENLNMTDSGDWIGSTGLINNLVLDSDRNLIYLWTNIDDDKLGVYNRTSNITENLNDTDIGDWIGTNNVNELLFNLGNKIIYLFGDSGVFGSYNRTLNKSEDLNLPNDWFRFNAVKTLAFNSLNNLIYLGGTNNRFGTYNSSLNEKQDLRTTDTSSCFYSLTVSEMTHDSINDLIYLAGSSFLCSFNISSNTTENLGQIITLIPDAGINALTFNSINNLVYMNRGGTLFFSYNVSTNTTENLATTDNNGWMTTTTQDMSFDSTDNLIYIVGNSGQFGVYNVSKNVTESLNDTDSVNWIKNTNLNAITYDSNNKLVYLIGINGIFGVYNRTSNSTENLNSTDSGDWINNSILNRITSDNDTGLIYLVGNSGIFGVYNRTSNSTEDLRGTDSGDWVSNKTLNAITYNSMNRLVYFGGEEGIFGIYNRTSNTTTATAALGAGTSTTPSGGDSPTSSPGIVVTTSIEGVTLATIPSINPGTPAVIEISSSYSSLRRISIDSNINISNVSLTLSPTNISDADFQVIAGGKKGESYEAYNIEFTGDNNDLDNVTIEFRVNKTWLDESGFSTSNLALYRKPKNDSQWKVLETTFLSNDTIYYYFSAISKGFSTFLIFVGEDECIPAEKRCFENEVQFCLGNKKWLVSEVCDYKCVNGACVDKGLQVNLNPLVVYPIIGIVVVGVLVSFLAQRMPKMKKQNGLTTSALYKRFGKR